MTTTVMINETLDLIKKESKHIIEELGEQHVPIMFLFREGNIDIVDLRELMSDKGKEVYGAVISTFLRAIRADAYIAINEAWAHTAKQETLTTRRLMAGEIQVSDLPPDDREEILIIQVVKNHEYAELHSAKIFTSNKDNRLLGEWKKADDVGEGRMIVKEW